MIKKIIFIVIGVGVLVGISLVGYYFTQVNSAVSDSNTETIFTVESGIGVKEIAGSLEKKKLIKSSLIFEWYVYFNRNESNFMAGNHIIKPNMNVKEIVEILTAGKSVPEESITIIEGWNIDDIASYLEAEDVLSSSDFIDAASTTDVNSLIVDANYSFLADKPADQGLEGYLFPDTYRIFADADEVDIIEKMLDNFGFKFTEQMIADAATGDMSVYEIVTLASIIEKEVSLDKDRKIVAGIFYNRLNNDIGLQSDATVNYVTSGDRPQPTSEDLEVDSPYNTYKYRGLPPGPISNPSLSSLMAALYPEKSDYFYFLSRIHEDGSTVFSKTFAEHLDNKVKYLDR